MQADVILAEPGAMIGFAGPRVIEQTIRQKLPEGFQTAEFLLEHGLLDLIVPRRALRDTLATLLRLYAAARGAQDEGVGRVAPVTRVMAESRPFAALGTGVGDDRH